MSTFHKVAQTSNVRDDKGHCVTVHGQRIGLYRKDGKIYAIDDVCTHADASLCDGDVSGGEVVCPLHFATFDIATGRCTGPPGDGDLRTYPVRINGDDVEIEV